MTVSILMVVLDNFLEILNRKMCHLLWFEVDFRSNLKPEDRLNHKKLKDQSQIFDCF